ncbi:hypothetical protein BTVI_08732 [Pitangus sulphuratus]|nr:hypothetical protein BTVI_08732 [Pitangus sulphuratus]
MLISHLNVNKYKDLLSLTVADNQEIRYPRGTTTIDDGLGFGQGGSVLESAGIGYIGQGGSFQHCLTEATFVDPLVPKPCHTTQIQESET